MPKSRIVPARTLQGVPHHGAYVILQPQALSVQMKSVSTWLQRVLRQCLGDLVCSTVKGSETHLQTSPEFIHNNAPTDLHLRKHPQESCMGAKEVLSQLVLSQIGGDMFVGSYTQATRL